MRALWKDVLLALWMGILLPGIILNGVVLGQERNFPDEVPAEQVESVETEYLTVHWRDDDGAVVRLGMDDYLTNVLLAEMPASFEQEALKAQSVAARTYAWKTVVTGGKHGDGSLCGDPTCCQGCVTSEEYLAGGGTEENLEKVRLAVLETTGEILTYDGSPIEATYFSSSGGTTEAAIAVWGIDYPYLQSVDSPEKMEAHTEIWSEAAFQKLLGIELPKERSQWIGPAAYTDGGGVSEIEIGGTLYTGVQLRNLLGLRSTDFEITLDHGVVIVRSFGYGHRVGLSQHGANVMAENGGSYTQILSHYYPGTELVRIP